MYPAEEETEIEVLVYTRYLNFLASNGCTVPPARVAAAESRRTFEVWRRPHAPI